MRIYSYLFYRLVRMWVRFGFADWYGFKTKESMESIFLSSITIVSLVQLSNVSTLLMIPLMLLHKQISLNIIFCISVAIIVVNTFILNTSRLYEKCEVRWKDEPKRVSVRRKWLAIIFFVFSMVMLFVSGKVAFIPHSLTFFH